MHIDPATVDQREMYQWLIGLVTPRPIGWVSTLSADGKPNLAPFSFFNAVGSNPPSVIFCPSDRRDGTRKDSALNVEETREFVVNIATEETAAAMNATSAEVPRGVNEFELAGLTPLPSVKVKPPRVKESPAHLECRLTQIVRVGTGPLSANLIIGEVVLFHIDERVVRNGRPDPRLLKTIARLGGEWYCRSADGLFEMARPK